MLWYSCRSALVARPVLRPRVRAVVPLFDGWRDTPRHVVARDAAARYSWLPPRVGMRSIGVPAAAAFRCRVPGARPGSVAAR